MKTGLLVRGLSVALLLAGGHARAASFSAELVDRRGTSTDTGTFAFDNGNYRFELPSHGQKVVVIFQTQTGVTHLLVPAEKRFIAAGRDDPRSAMLSAFAAYATQARQHGVRNEGTETIAGLPCTKQVVASGDQVFVVAWISEDLGLPLKIEIPVFNHTVELRAIQRGPQEASLFAVPADYRPAPTADDEPPPEWAAHVASAPQVTPPFDQKLSEGRIVRVRPQAGRKLRLHATSGPGTVTAVGFKDGRPTSSPKGNSFQVGPDTEASMTFDQTPSEADAIVVRIRDGSVAIRFEWVDDAGPTRPAPAAPEPHDATPPAASAETTAELSAPTSAAMGSRFEVRWSGPAANDDFITVARAAQPPAAYLSMTRVREGNPLKVWAPSDVGEYEVRYVLARGSKVLARAPLTVKPVTAGLEVDGSVKAADWIEVTWEGPGGESDFVSVARPDQPPGAVLARVSVKQGTTVRLRAPADAGTYEVRYVLGRGAKLLAKAPLTVEPVAATVAAPAAVRIGAEFEVRWTGPGYREDLVVIARTDQKPNSNVGSKATRTGNPVKLRAPKEPGVYELRYILGPGTRILAAAPITIEAP